MEQTRLPPLGRAQGAPAGPLDRHLRVAILPTVAAQGLQGSRDGSRGAESTTDAVRHVSAYPRERPRHRTPHTKYSSRTELVFDKLIARSALLLQAVAAWPVVKPSPWRTSPRSRSGPPHSRTPTSTVSSRPCLKKPRHRSLPGEHRERHDRHLLRDVVGAAEDGSSWNGYEPFFSAWFESQEYRTPAPADFQRTPEEEELIKLYSHKGLTSNDQLYLASPEGGTNGLDLFKQEYPSTRGRPSSRPAARLQQRVHHERLRTRAQAPHLDGCRETYDEKSGKELPLRMLREHPRGELKCSIRRRLDPRHT
jgi:hypothetical protein